MNQHKINSSFIVIISVFFFWGFVAASNGILIPLFKHKFTLTQFQSQLVDLAFYFAYFVGALIYFIVSAVAGDPLNKIGYKRGLVYGLILSSIGALMFIPAANQNSYGFLLIALFTIGLGFALQQIVANPFVVNFGDRSRGAQRLNMAGGINSFGTTIGPVLLSLALFGSVLAPKPDLIGLESVKTPALFLFGLFAFCALIISVSKLPQVSNTEHFTGDLGALRYPQLSLGMIAIFCYVGVEVTIQSNLGALLAMKEIKGIDHTRIAPYISLFWGSLMVGRWTGSLSVFNLGKDMRLVLQFLVPLVAFGIVCMVNYIVGNEIGDFIFYLPVVIIGSILFVAAGDKPAKVLLILSLSACLMMLIGLFSSGTLALLSFISGGLFCSVMFPCIFSLAINGLGKYTNQASSLLIMMILGGALIPPFQGWIADKTNPHTSYIVTLFCFGYLAFYAFRVRNIPREDAHKDEMAVDEHIVSGH